MTGTVVALADKLETLVGIWGIGLQPTGDKDPFALRRHALGVLRMLVEKRLPLALSALLAGRRRAVRRQRQLQGPGAPTSPPSCRPPARPAARARLHAERSRGRASPSSRDRWTTSCSACEAVQAFAALPEAEALAAANKRITNILKKADVRRRRGAGRAAAGERRAGPACGDEQPEARRSTPPTRSGDFAGTLKALARLRDDVDAFFNDVMVMAEDPALRNNRLALLSELHGMMNRVADISKLAA